MNEIANALKSVESMIGSLGKQNFDEQDNRETINNLLHNLLGLYFIPPPPSEGSKHTSEEFLYLWKRIVEKYNLPLYKLMSEIETKKGKEFTENLDDDCLHSLSKIHTQVENDYEKRMDSLPVFKSNFDTETLDIFQSHPADLAVDTISMSISDMDDMKKRQVVRAGNRVDLTREISLKVTRKEKRYNNNKKKFVSKMNPFL